MPAPYSSQRVFGITALMVCGMLFGEVIAVAQQPGRSTYQATPRSSGNKAARIGGGPAGRSSAPRQAGGSSLVAPRGAARPQVGASAPKGPQVGASAPKGPQMGGGGGASSRLPAGVQLPQQPGQGNFIQPRK